MQKKTIDLIIELSSVSFDYILYSIAIKDNIEKLKFINSFHLMRDLNIFYNNFGADKNKIYIFAKHNAKKCIRYIYDICIKNDLINDYLEAVAQSNNYELFKHAFKHQNICLHNIFDALYHSIGREKEINDYNIIKLIIKSLQKKPFIFTGSSLMELAIKHMRDDLIIKLAGCGITDKKFIQLITVMCKQHNLDKDKFLAPFMSPKFPLNAIKKYEKNQQELSDILVDINQKYYNYDKNSHTTNGKKMFNFPCDIIFKFHSKN